MLQQLPLMFTFDHFPTAERLRGRAVLVERVHQVPGLRRPTGSPQLRRPLDRLPAEARHRSPGTFADHQTLAGSCKTLDRCS